MCGTNTRRHEAIGITSDLIKEDLGKLRFNSVCKFILAQLVKVVCNCYALSSIMQYFIYLISCTMIKISV